MRHITIGHWDLELKTAKQPWTHFKVHPNDIGWHVVWGKLSLSIENWTIEAFPVCKECGCPEAHEVSYGDEGWTHCPDCQTIEGGYRYVNKRESER